MSLHAWFSEGHAKLSGYAEYQSSNGLVKCTAVSKNKDYEKEYNWPDKKYLGLVGEFIGECQGIMLRPNMDAKFMTLDDRN